MKTIAVLSMTLLFGMAITQSQARVKEQTQLKESSTGYNSERNELNMPLDIEITEVAKNQFYEDFGDVTNVDWKSSEAFVQVSFTKDGQNMKAFYDEDSKLVGTTIAKSFTDLPKKGQLAIKTKFKDYTPGTVFLYQNNEVDKSEMILYGIQFEDSDNYFVEMSKGTEKIVVIVTQLGNASIFKRL